MDSQYIGVQEHTALGQSRGKGAPQIDIVPSITESRPWGTVDISVPFEEPNELLGSQLQRTFLHAPCDKIRSMRWDEWDQEAVRPIW